MIEANKRGEIVYSDARFDWFHSIKFENMRQLKERNISLFHSFFYLFQELLFFLRSRFLLEIVARREHKIKEKKQTNKN